MSQYLLEEGFRWLTEHGIGQHDFITIPANSQTGFVLEVDLDKNYILPYFKIWFKISVLLKLPSNMQPLIFFPIFSQCVNNLLTMFSSNFPYTTILNNL